MSESQSETISWNQRLRSLTFTELRHEGESHYDAAARISQPTPSKVSTELTQYIKDLYASGAKLWTKEMFLKMEEGLSKEPRPSLFMTDSMNGGSVPKELPGKPRCRKDHHEHTPSIQFKLYQMVLFDTQLIFSQESLDRNAHLLNQEINMDEIRAIVTCALDLSWVRDEPPEAIEYSALRAAWDEAQKNWTESSTCKNLIKMLKNDIKIPKSAKKIVCFGLGNLEGYNFNVAADEEYFPHRRSMTQHAAALTMADVFGELLGTNSLPILVQDPCYSPITKQLLVELGFEVAGGYGALAFTRVDEEAIVVSCHPDIPVKQVVADIARPAAMIWNRVTGTEEEKSEWLVRDIDNNIALCSPWITDQDSPRTREMMEDYDRHAFPVDWDRFGDLEICVRKD